MHQNVCMFLTVTEGIRWKEVHGRDGYGALTVNTDVLGRFLLVLWNWRLHLDIIQTHILNKSGAMLFIVQFPSILISCQFIRLKYAITDNKPVDFKGTSSSFPESFAQGRPANNSAKS